MFNIILFQPEIPSNTGNVIRLCANTGAQLHLIKPLGFTLQDKQLLRAGLDYHEFATMFIHKSWSECRESLGGHRFFAVSTKGKQYHHVANYICGDAFLFGSETRGLPIEIMTEFSEKQRIRLPMVPESRSLNLSNAVAVITYEAWRQIKFKASL